MQLIHCFFWNVTKMHQYTADCIFMTGNENSLSFINRLGYNSLRVERNRTLHAIPQTLRFRKLSMDLKWLRLNTSIDCLRQRDAEIFYILGSLVIISRITKWVGRHWWWPNLESTTPFLIKRRWMSAKWNNYIADNEDVMSLRMLTLSCSSPYSLAIICLLLPVRAPYMRCR